MEQRHSARHQSQEPTVAREDGARTSGDESDDEFSFSFGGPEPAATGGAAADELVYPVFGRVFEDARTAPLTPDRTPLRRLFLEEARNSSVGSTSSTSSSYSSAAADLDGASPDTYCVWTPGASAASSPARSPRKSGSTGSLSRWRRVSQLVVGRSSSVGRDKFGSGFLSAPASPAREEWPKAKPAPSPGRNGKAATEVGTVAASHRMFYGAAKPSPGAPRRTFLPYRQDLFGIFSAPKGLSRSQFQYQPAI